MRFTEKNFSAFVEKLRANRSGCDTLIFKQDNGIKNIRHKGPALIQHDDAFLENLYEHLLCANMMWFDQLSSRFNQVEMTVPVLSDGAIDHNQITFEIRYPIPNELKPKWNVHMLHQFQDLLPFSKYFTNIKFSVHKRNLYHVFVYGVISGKEVNKVERVASYNKQIAAQWQSAFLKVNEIKKGQEHIIQEMKVINGQIRTETANIEQIHVFEF